MRFSAPIGRSDFREIRRLGGTYVDKTQAITEIVAPPSEVLVHLAPDWEVRSNQELGYGRADVVVRPRVAGRPGAVIEFKKLRAGRTVQGTLRSAMAQIKRREYAAGLQGVADPIYLIAIVFEGKRVHVKMTHHRAAV